MRLAIILLASILAACAVPGPTIQEQVDRISAQRVSRCENIARLARSEIGRGVSPETLRNSWKAAGTPRKAGIATTATNSYGVMIINAVYRHRALPAPEFAAVMASECRDIVYLTS